MRLKILIRIVQRQIDAGEPNKPLTHPLFKDHEFFLIYDDEHLVDELGNMYKIQDILSAIELTNVLYWKRGWSFHRYCRISDYTIPKFIEPDE